MAQKMKFLITGGLGFIGSNFILHVLEHYPNVKITNIDAEFVGSDHENLIDVRKNKNYRFVRGNINDKHLIEKLISTSDVVFNFAAESHVDRSISDAKPFIDSNILGVYSILEAIKKYKKKLVHISTDEVYGSLKSGSAKENDLFNPSNPYSATKASAELLILSYIKTYSCDVLITRCTNNYGPRQHSEKLIPRVIALAENGMKIPVYGTGKNIRDWLFVLDHCEAILKVFFEGKSGESYNISNYNEINNTTIIKKILKILGKPYSLMYNEEDRPGHDFRYSLDSTKIRKQLHWKPKYDFDEGLKYTIKWYLENKKWKKSISPKTLQGTPWKAT